VRTFPNNEDNGVTVETPQSIHEFWFGTDPDDQTVATGKSSLWWSKNTEVDAEIARRFADLIDLAAAGGLSDWEATPRGLLALILLTDQFPRNAYRQKARAFVYDAHARRWCHLAIRRGIQAQLRPVERVFLLLPLEHAETLQDQERCVTEMRAMAADAPANFAATAAGYVDYAIRHRDIIARFGRFPHRNAILGRLSTPEEIAFLQEPGSSF